MHAKALFVNILYCTRLAFQSLGLVVQVAMKRRKAKSTFKKTLILKGIPPKIANKLTEEYPNPITEFFSFLKRQ